MAVASTVSSCSRRLAMTFYWPNRKQTQNTQNNICSNFKKTDKAVLTARY